MEFLLAQLSRFAPMVVTLALVLLILSVSNLSLRRRWQDKSELQFRFQLIMLGLTFIGAIAVLITLPLEGNLRGQLLGLIGILLSAAIALSSTTFIGNIMAGIMLRAVKSVRPGDFITVGTVTGRVTEMDLLHSEIQTEDRDLVTVPNMFLVSQPMKVVRASGTIVSAEVSLGYEVPRQRIAALLIEAAGEAGLQDGFVHVRELGDFSVTYRVAGLLSEVSSLISARSRLREAVLDSLHGAGIEIVSPNFMNQRILKDGEQMIPLPTLRQAAESTVHAEELAFDKADEAASVEQMRRALKVLAAEQEALEEGDASGADAAQAALEARKQVLKEQLESAEALLKAKDEADRAGGKD